MLWFDGSIKCAVDKVKSSGVVLVVFVQGSDELSTKYENFLNEEKQTQPQDYVALKISDNSVAFQQFKNIYVTVPVPSLFVIQNNGVPLRVTSSENIFKDYNEISDVIKKQKLQKQNQNQKTVREIKEEIPQEESKNLPESNEKVNKSSYAKNIGYKLFDACEEEIKYRLNETRAFPRFLVVNKSFSKNETFRSSISQVYSARLQFRLPNNEVPSWEFPSLSTLGDVRAYLIEKMKLAPNFKLLRTYPRTGFTPEDDNKTLVDLSLIPNATLIVIPVQDKIVQAKSIIVQPNILTMLIQSFLRPFAIVLNFFKKHFIKFQAENINVTPASSASETSVGNISNKKTSTSNIHSFKFEDDSDSESDYPDNGNSTQQRFQ